MINRITKRCKLLCRNLKIMMKMEALYSLDKAQTTILNKKWKKRVKNLKN